MTAASSARPVLFGEVLFDCFADGSRVLGGAPFNVAWHLAGLGHAPLLISRVGSDDLGDRVLEAMKLWNLDTSGIQRDPERPTGAVEVAVDSGGQPSFDIRPDAAWDEIELDPALEAIGSTPAPLLGHGTLAARAATSAATLAELRTRLAAPVFLDVNLRPPWWSITTVESQLLGARWVKLNGDELAALESPDDPRTPRDDLALAARFHGRFALDTLIVTRGGDGALVLGNTETTAARPPATGIAVVDTVGAGDAFSAAWIAGLLEGWPRQVALERALELAAVVCGLRGAVIPDRESYSRLRDHWRQRRRDT